MGSSLQDTQPFMQTHSAPSTSSGVSEVVAKPSSPGSRCLRSLVLGTWLSVCPQLGRDGDLASAPSHSGVQARALGDVQLHHLLRAGGVDPYCLHHLCV